MLKDYQWVVKCMMFTVFCFSTGCEERTGPCCRYWWWRFWLITWLGNSTSNSTLTKYLFVLFLICKTCLGICYTIKVTKMTSMMFLVYSLVNIATHVIPPSIAYVDPPSRGAEGKKRERGTWRASYAGYMLLSGLLV